MPGGDVQIRNDGDGFDVVLVDGDLVMLDGDDVATEVGQRVTYHLMTWLGESPYDRSAGIPYEQIIFGFEEVPGIGGLLLAEVQSIEGVAEILGEPTFELEGHTLSVGLTVRAVGDNEIPVALDIDALLWGAGLG